MTNRDPDLRTANLGLATTREMLEELQARGRAGVVRSDEKDSIHLESDADHLLKCLSAETLDYRTVDHV